MVGEGAAPAEELGKEVCSSALQPDSASTLEIEWSKTREAMEEEVDDVE
jgi:hypothetical protein